MVIGRRQQLELREAARDVSLNGLRCQEQPVADRLVRAAFGDEPQKLALAAGQVVQGVRRFRRPTSSATTSDR
jgi:hypothetical protein